MSTNTPDKLVSRITETFRRRRSNSCKSHQILFSLNCYFSARGSEENTWGAGSVKWVDIVFVQIHGIDQIDWQGKEVTKCFEKARIGFENNANAYSEAVNNDVNYADCIVNA
jgi:hypothetical protein